MKIVYNTDQIYLHGGIEKVMATKANYLANLPMTEVIIVTTEQKSYPPCYPLDKKIKLIDLGIDYNRSKSYFSKENLKKAVKHYQRQKELFRELNPDVIISPNFNFDFYWLPVISKKSKTIKEFHSSRYKWKPTLRNKINLWFEKIYDHIVVLNKDEATYFKSNNVTVIPNPIEKNNYSSSLTEKKVVAAGRIAPVKGFDHLITAWKQVNQKHPEWELHIYGNDYVGTQDRLQNQINYSNLQKTVFFKGNVNNLPKKMTDYSIYAMSSVTECFPTVLLESLSVGLPIVSYDCPNGPRNIITNNREGLLVENQNHTALAEGIIQLIEDEFKRKEFGKNALMKSNHFEIDNIMKMWISLFNSLKK